MLKKMLALCFIATACFACGNNSSSNSASPANVAAAGDSANKKEAAQTADISNNPDYKKGLELIGKSDCLTCHKIEETSTGPAYRDVANKYPNNEATMNTLAEKIIKGGSGNWGSVPMAAHPNLSEADAKQILKYIFLLKTK
jgi:cytochrome c